MRSTVVFEVRGENFKDLHDKAVQIYREYMNDPEAVPPPGSFHIEVSPGHIKVETFDGMESKITAWVGSVTITNHTSDT